MGRQAALDMIRTTQGRLTGESPSLCGPDHGGGNPQPMSTAKTCRSGTRRLCRTRPRQWAPRTNFKLSIVGLALTTECWYRPRVGYTPTAMYHGRGAWGTPATTFPPAEVKPVKRRNVGGAGANDVVTLADQTTTVMAPLKNLVAHCAVRKYEDGTARTPGWWTVKTMGSAWVVQVKDPDACAQLQATAAKLDDALALADLLLGSEEAPWEPDPWLQKGRGKKSA